MRPPKIHNTFDNMNKNVSSLVKDNFDSLHLQYNTTGLGQQSQEWYI